MTGNIFRKPQQEQKEQRERGKLEQVVSGMLNGSLLTRDASSPFMPFVLYLAGLALLLIFNAYYAEGKAREADHMRTQIEELRIRYIETKSAYMYLTNQSEIARRLRGQGFVESKEPPMPIVRAERNRSLWSRVRRTRN